MINPQDKEITTTQSHDKFREVQEPLHDTTSLVEEHTSGSDKARYISPGISGYIRQIREGIVAFRQLPWSNIIPRTLDYSIIQNEDRKDGAIVHDEKRKTLFKQPLSKEPDIRGVLESPATAYMYLMNRTKQKTKSQTSLVDVENLFRHLPMSIKKEVPVVGNKVGTEIYISKPRIDPELLATKHRYNDDEMPSNPEILDLMSQTRHTLRTHVHPEHHVHPDQDRIWRLKKVLRLTLADPDRLIRCNNLTKSSSWKVGMTDHWHSVEDRLMYVYSAFLDERVQGYNIVRVIGMVESWEAGIHLRPYCQIWLKERAEPFIVKAHPDLLPGQRIAK